MYANPSEKDETIDSLCNTLLKDKNVWIGMILPTPLLNGKKLSSNSTWDFEPIFDTRNPYGSCPV